MSMSYCTRCLERTDNCECKECGGDCYPDVVYGERRVSFIEGYREGYKDATENKGNQYE